MRLEKARSNSDSLNAFVYLFGRMNDVHSAIYFRNQQYGYYKGVNAETAKRFRPLLDREQHQSGKTNAVVLQNKYAYILVPTIQAMGQPSINDFAQAIQDQVCKLGKMKPKGWIVDLRLNGGGNINPMLAGLANLLGSVTVAGDADADGKLVQKWSLSGGDLFLDHERQTSIGRKCIADYSRRPVVLLIGAITRSSGELTAIAFKGRPNTLFLGEATAEGYTTSNDYIAFGDDLALNLSTGFMMDRLNNVYRNYVMPDQVVDGVDDFDHLDDDAKVKAAIAWIVKSNRK